MANKTKTHTTNYIDTFIEVADDTKVASGKIPNSKGDKKTIAEIQYELLSKNPYQYTSDDLLFEVFTIRNDLTKAEYKQARDDFFAKPQPCFRTSPLTKSHGFGIHNNSHGKIALYGIETNEYQNLVSDSKIKKVKAMRSSKK